MAKRDQSSKKQIGVLYLPADFYMVRAPALPARVFMELSNAGHVPLEQTLEDDTLQQAEQACAALLLQLATRPEVRLALGMASPSLLEGLERFGRGEEKKAHEARIYASLLRYLVRMSTRPTPFGLFAGVGLGHFAERTDLRLGETAIQWFRTRPDMSWLLSLVRHLEKDPALVEQLSVRLNQTAYLAGERAVLPFADTYGQEDSRAISLRATSVVRKVFELTQTFIPYTKLQTAIHQAFSHATTQQIERVLWQLWEHGFLISSLHPPLTDARPAEYVRAQLDTLQGIDEVKVQLTRVLEDTCALDRAGMGAQVSLISRLVENQGKLVHTKGKDGLPLQADSALKLKTPLLHHSIGQVAAQAATFLLRQTPLPTGLPHLQEYRQLFLEKYGEQAEVPLLDLLSPENGLDAPASYENPPRSYDRSATLPAAAVDRRNQLLLQLMSEAVNQRRLEVELTEEIQRQLERWSPTLGEAPLSLEIYLQVHARSREAIDRGEWTAVVGSNCGSPHAGRTFGRFFDLLGEPGMTALRDLVAREESLLPDVIFAELSYQPWQARLANVATRPPLRSFEIAVGTTPSVPAERVLTLDDLVVSVQNGRFVLRSLRLGKPVRVCQSHMLTSELAPNVCRFLTEIANDGLPCLSMFDWESLVDAPFLPRLIMKAGPAATLVVAPARWHLQAETIVPIGEGTAETCWFRGLQQWRSQWRVPRYVYLVDGDNRLLLDLEHPLLAALLRDELKKLKDYLAARQICSSPIHRGSAQQRWRAELREHKQLTLEEVLPDFEHLWLRDAQDAGYLSEIVVPLLHADTLEPSARSASQHTTIPSSRPVIPPVERKRFPGEEWVYLKLYAALSQHEELLAGPLRDIVTLLQEHKLLDRWFFVRYADPEPHLRLRFHAREGQDTSAILAFVLPWSAQLARRGQCQRVALDTYEREVERYGGPAAIDLLEQVFTIDSALVCDLIAFQYAHRLTLDPLAVAVFTLDHCFASWGCTFQQRLAWTQQASEKYAFSKAYHAERKRYCDLLAPGDRLDESLVEQRVLLLELVCRYDTFLGELGKQVRSLAETKHLWVPEISLLSSLAHMHLNRLLGIDRNREQQVYAFWRHTLEALARHPG